MSRIGRAPIHVPAGVEVKVDEHNHITVKGPKGSIERTLVPQMKIDVQDGVIHVSRPDDTKENRSLHGLTRTLVDNMVIGVTKGFEKKLEINGVGYRAQKEGKNLVMNLGYSHQVTVSENEDIQIEVPDANHIIIKGIDKQKVGQFAAEVRGKRPPEPYKGKGIKYGQATPLSPPPALRRASTATAATSRLPRRSAPWSPSAPSRRALRKSCLTAAATFITAASRHWQTAPARAA